MLSILPENEYRFEDEAADPNNAKARRLKSIIGYGTRRRAKGTTTISDMLLFGLRKLISEERLTKEEIGAVVVVTLCPDYFLPQISSIIHGELELDRDVYCVDIPQACAGYITGLIESFQLLERLPVDKKVVLCTGEIFCRKSRDDEPKFEEPSFGGDIANITIVENTPSDQTEKTDDAAGEQIICRIYNDGSQRNALIIKDGGYRHPMGEEQLAIQTSNIPCLGVTMEGSGVFNFVQKEVPPMIHEIAERSGHDLNDFDHFLFHQPNKFMLQKLATALQIPYDKLPMDITEKLGNSDSGTIPAVMTSDVAESLTQGADKLCCLSGFGGGLTWGAIVMHIGGLRFCENVVSDL